MNYNKIFRVFDHGDSVADRYTVFLRNDPSSGALFLNDQPTHPSYGFSQWGEFDLDIIEQTPEISFSDLPPNVQKHIIDRFEITESNILKDIVLCIMEDDKSTAALGVKNLIIDKFEKLTSGNLNEFNKGAIKIVGDDVLVNGKRVGSITNDLNDFKKGIVLSLDDGSEHDFTTIQELFNFIMDKFRIRESTENKKKIVEATQDQKIIVKGLRALAKKLNIPSPRFRSLGGKAGYVEMSPKNWREESIPNELRKKAVVKVLNAVPLNFDNVSYGNVRAEYITLTVPQWALLLSYYGIDVPLSEGYTILPDLDRERYRNREHEGLEGPFRAKNGKVVYYDPKEGAYYDPDSDIYLTYSEWESINT